MKPVARFFIKIYKIIILLIDIMKKNLKLFTEDMFKGHKVTMINIWATTCHGCIMEIQMGVLKSVIAYPTTIFLDENGNQLKVMEGSRSKSMWIDTIEEVIESEK